MTKVKVLVTRLDPELPIPDYAKAGDAGADLRARIDLTIRPGERALVPTGIAIALPAGYAAFVHPRSGLALRSGIGMVNAPGTIDSGYRGELQVILINHGQEDVVITRGDRIAQLVIRRVEEAEFVEVASLPGASRGNDGFGSTGRI